MKALLIALLLCGFVSAQEPEHKFFDKTARFSLAGSAAIFAADAAQSCYGLGVDHREGWLPVKSCAGISLWMVGSSLNQAAMAYGLHRWHHHKLERIIEFGWAAGSIAGIALSQHSHLSAPAIIPVHGGHVVHVCIVGQSGC